MVLTNFTITVQFSEPMDPGSINPNTFGIYSTTLNEYVPGNISISSDLKTATFVPTTSLTPGDTIYPLSNGALDLSGNPQQTTFCGYYACSYYEYLIVGATADTTTPQVTETILVAM